MGVIVLDEAAVTEHLPMAECIDAMEQVLGALARGEAQNLEYGSEIAENQLRHFLQVDGEFVRPQFHHQQRLRQDRNIGKIVDWITRNPECVRPDGAARPDVDCVCVQHDSTRKIIGNPGGFF